MRNQMNIQVVVPLTPIVKKLIIANVSIWILFTIILENYFVAPGFFSKYFGLVPGLLFEKFFVWQIFSYMFLHATSISHILFNMLLLWWLGSELEQRWGSKFFLLYYVVCGVGAGLVYMIGLTFYYLTVGPTLAWVSPVVGASGAIFGLLLAYGIIFGDRIVYFFMLFPMQAKYFVMILAGIEFITLLNSKASGESNVANLCHLGGILVGYLFLYFWTKWSIGRRGKDGRTTNRRGLKLVVNNETPENQGPKFWN
jgi:membrane associated rhomboid family serine protease